MRIHFLITAILSVATIALVWWSGVKNKDFLKPPSAQVIAAARQTTLASLSAPQGIESDQPAKAILVKPTKLTLPNPELETVVKEEKETQVDLGDLATVPGLDQYADLSEKGPEAMISLATQLETIGELQRALLAWERVLDIVSADADQRAMASKALVRLTPQLPPWNIDPSATQVIVFQAGCDRDTATALEPFMKEVADMISASTSGILQVQAKVHAGPRPTKDGPKLPIALWFGGQEEKSQQSKTITIGSDYADPQQMRQALISSAYKLIRDEIGSQTAFQAPIELKSDQDASALFSTAVTRLLWQEFGGRLNVIPAP